MIHVIAQSPIRIKTSKTRSSMDLITFANNTRRGTSIAMQTISTITGTSTTYGVNKGVPSYPSRENSGQSATWIVG